MLNRRRAATLAHTVIQLRANGAIVAQYTDLDQLMVGQGPIDFSDNRISQTSIADHDDRFERVRAGLEVTALGDG